MTSGWRCAKFARVLRADGTFALVVIGQNAKVFNRLYDSLREAGPVVLGPPGGTRGAGIVQEAGMRIETTQVVRQRVIRRGCWSREDKMVCVNSRLK